MTVSRNRLMAIYFAGTVALIAVGVALQLTGHSGDPFWGLGVVLALMPGVVTWLRPRLTRH